MYVFGSIQDGSLTAFLLEHYEAVGARQELIWLLWMANAVVSLSVLVTFPLQLFPALELVQKAVQGWSGRRHRGPAFVRVQTNDAEQNEDNDNVAEQTTHDAQSELSPVFTIDDEDDDDDDDMEAVPQRTHESFVDEPLSQPQQSNHEPAVETATSSFSSCDDIVLRIALVLFTYVIAIVVPNVQSLIALAGALAGSLTALILPPILSMAKGGGGAWSWVSLIMGTMFGMVGTVAALMDVVKSKE